MQNILLLIKGFKGLAKSFTLLFALVFMGLDAIAQAPAPAQVSVTVNIMPPYSPYYSDYSSLNAGKVLLIVRNLTATQKSIKIAGQLTGDNGVSIITKSTYMPLQPIVLQPNETKQLNGTALKDIFDLNSLNVYGIDKQKLVQTSRLPGGNYTFCLQAVDVNTNKTISDVAPNGCTAFNINYPNAPILIAPAAFSKEEAMPAQSVTFSWINAGTVPMNTQYIIQIVEMPDVPRNPNQLLDATSFYMLNQRIIGTTYRYGAGNVPLKIGKTYAWRVIASDPSNKTGFMNDGKSQANVFIYGNTQQLAIANPQLATPTNLLNIISPACNTSKVIAYVGPNVNLKLNWLWKEQIESIQAFGNLDTNLIKHYTKVNITPIAPSNVQLGVKSVSKANGSGLNSPQIFETIKSYRIQAVRQKGKLGLAVIDKNINAPTQELILNYSEASKLGFAIGNSYILKVTVLNQNGKEIGKTESCEWTLMGEPPAPKLMVKGKLKYTFDKKKYYGANKTNIIFQIVDKPNDQIDHWSALFGGVQKVGYATTDADGNFIGYVDKSPSDTGQKYISIEVVSPYYQKPEQNLPVNIFKSVVVNDGANLSIKPDTVKLNDINVNAYNYAVTVNLSKQFDALYNTNFIDDKGVNVSQNINVGVTTQNTKINAGILVGIYRKAKKDDLPKYEGDVDAKSPQFPIPYGGIRIAEAKTIIKDGKTQVVFDKLLLSWANDEEYYIKAILPKADPKNTLQNDNDADLAAPDQRLAFYPQTFQAATQNYATTVDYKIISKKPPTAKIKGKIMEQWPSTPGVLHPYANKPFTVKMASGRNIPSDYSELLGAPNCQYYPSVLKQKLTDANGKVTYVNPSADITTGYNGTVATGITDKDGNYELSIIDFMEMHDYDLVVTRYSNSPAGKTCDEKQKEKDDAEAARLKHLRELETPILVVNSGTMRRQVTEARKRTGNGLGGEQAGGDGYVSIDDEVVIGTTASSLAGKYGGSGSNSNPFSGGPSTNPSGGGTNYNLQGNLAAAAAAAALQHTNFSQNLNLHYFVAPDDLPENKTDQENIDISTTPAEGDINGVYSRYFTIEGIEPVSTINNDANQTAKKFQVQPFGSVNLGVSVINVDENRDFKLTVSVKGQTTSTVLSGAKVVVFRVDKKQPMAGPYPVDEGSAIHPNKKLINTNYAGNGAKYVFGVTGSYDVPGESQPRNQYGQVATNAYNGDVEWVLDKTIDGEPVSGTNKMIFNLGDKRLWKKGDYYVQITPGPEGDGGRFDPMIKQIDLNYDFSPVEVQLSPSRIAGRVQDKSSSKPIANATVTIKVYPEGKTDVQTKTLTTDANGYFEIVNGANGISWENNAHYEASAVALGYADARPGIRIPGKVVDPVVAELDRINKLKVLQKDGRNYDEKLEKTPGTKLTITVFGEQAGTNESITFLPIKVYVERKADGAIFTNEVDAKTGKILPTVKVDALINVAQSFKIIPEDPAYFDNTLDITPVDAIVSQPSIKLYRRKHRMQFTLQGADGKIIPPAMVSISINNKAVLSKNNGPSTTYFEFENVSISNYTIQITPINQSGYVPKIINITNYETEQAKNYPLITLEKGAAVSGFVTLNNNKIKNARVYVDYATSDAIPGKDAKNNVAALECITDENGHYEITGIPIDKQTIKIHATLNVANTTVNGAEKDVPITDKLGDVNFALTSFNNVIINNVYGFPLGIEKIENIAGSNKFKVTGIVDIGKGTSAFTYLNPDTKIRISDVVFEGGSNNQPTGPVTLDAVANIKMKYMDKYNVLLVRGSGAGQLQIQKLGDGGAIMARVNITDNSFNFPSSYLDFNQTSATGIKSTIPFYLSTLNKNVLFDNETTIKAIYTGSTEAEKYYLSGIDGKALSFKFAGFEDTKANPRSSYIAPDGKIHLSISFTGNVPNAKPSAVDLKIEDLVLDANQIYPSEGTKPLILNLQTWKLEVKNWTVDVTKGGIVSTSAVMKTGMVDVPVKTFNLRHDNFIMQGFDIKNLSLGSGLLKLTNIDTTNFHLVYDEACGSDQQPHWRFSGTTANGKTAVASIPLPAVKDKFDAANLDVKYFQLISYNNENLVSLTIPKDGVSLYKNSRFKFFPQSISSDLNSFSLGGQAIIDVPRVNPVAANLLFTKSGDMELADIDLKFETKGYVQFKSGKNPIISSTNGITSIKGKVEEPDKFNPIDCNFVFGSGNANIGVAENKGTIKLDQDKDLALDTKGLSVKIGAFDNSPITGVKNGIAVTDGDWGTLKFSGELTDPGIPKTMVMNKPIYYFEVLGDITANSEKLKIDDIKTPLGDVAMTYDFASKRMKGSLHMNGVEFGNYSFSGDVEVGYGGSEGFLLMGVGQLNTGTLFLLGGDGFGTFNIGLLFATNAKLSETSIQKVTQYSKSTKGICWLNDNKDQFTGFYLTGGYDIINEHKGLDIGVASVYFNAVLGVEATIGANFAKEKNLIAILGAHGLVSAGMSAITGTSISGEIGAHITANATYDKTGFAIEGGAGVTVKYKVSQYLVLETVEFDGSIEAGVDMHLQKGNSAMTFYLGKSNGVSACPDK